MVAYAALSIVLAFVTFVTVAGEKNAPLGPLERPLFFLQSDLQTPIFQREHVLTM